MSNHNDTELKKGIKEEQEHLDTLNKVAEHEITPKEAVKEIAETHIEKNPHAYDSETYSENGLNKELLKTVLVRGEAVKIYLVNATYVRTHYKEYPDAKDWNSGGHHLGWGTGMEFIPKAQIWLDDSADEKARNGFLIHELSEYENMLYNGMDYKKAHTIANKKEQEYLTNQVKSNSPMENSIQDFLDSGLKKAKKNDTFESGGKIDESEFVKKENKNMENIIETIQQPETTTDMKTYKDYYKLPIGTEIYYIGDQANEPEFGKIISEHEKTAYTPYSYNIEMENGKIKKGIIPLMFTGVGKRFQLKSERNEEREKIFKNMRENFKTDTLEATIKQAVDKYISNAKNLTGHVVAVIKTSDNEYNFFYPMKDEYKEGDLQKESNFEIVKIIEPFVEKEPEIIDPYMAIKDFYINKYTYEVITREGNIKHTGTSMDDSISWVNEQYEPIIGEKPIEAFVEKEPESESLPTAETAKLYLKQLVASYLKSKDKKTLKLIEESVSDFIDGYVADDFYLLPELYEMLSDIPKKSLPDLYFHSDEQFFDKLDKNLWHYLPEVFKKVSKVTKVPFILSPENEGLKNITSLFIAKDALLPIMNSLYFDEDGVTCTDAHKMIFLHGKPVTLGEYCLHTDCFKTNKTDTQDKIVPQSTYPDYKRVIPELSGMEHYTIHVNSLILFLNTLRNANLLSPASELSIIKYGENYIGFKASFLHDCLKTMQKLGNEEVDICIGEPTRTVIIVAKGNKDKVNRFETDFILLMPMLIKSDYGSIDLDKKGYLYFDLINESVKTTGIIDDEVVLSPEILNEKSISEKIKIEARKIVEDEKREKEHIEARKIVKEAKQKTRQSVKKVVGEHKVITENTEKLKLAEEYQIIIDGYKDMISETKDKKLKKEYQMIVDGYKEMINELEVEAFMFGGQIE